MVEHTYCALVALALLAVVTVIDAKKDERDCEVCIGAINKFKKSADVTDAIISDPKKSEVAFKKFCKNLPRVGKENRFCYFVGGTEDAATGILSNLLKPLSYHMPAEKICGKLKVMDTQICELRYETKPDFSKLKKMKVRELKNILASWGEDMACKVCAEKQEFVSKVRELMPKYEPEEWAKLQKAEL